MENQKRIYNESERGKIHYFIKKIIEKDYKRLLFFCFKFFHSNNYKSIDIEPDDVIYDTIKLILEGRRTKINLKSYEAFRKSFYKVIRNYLLDIFNGNKNKYNSFKESFNSEGDEDYEYMGEFSGNISISDDYERKEIIEKIREILKPHKEEFEVFELMWKGYQRDEIAKGLNIKPSEVTNIRKRIIRRLKPIPKSMIN